MKGPASSGGIGPSVAREARAQSWGSAFAKAVAGQAMTTRPGTCRGGLSRHSRAKVEAFACWHSSFAKATADKTAGQATWERFAGNGILILALDTGCPFLNDFVMVQADDILIKPL